MKQSTGNRSSKKRFWQGRGFYVILALCLIAVGGLGVATLIDTLSLSGDSGDSSAGTTTAAPVGRPVTNVRDPRTTASRTGTTATTAPPTTQAAPVDTPPADLFILPLTNEVLAPYSLTPVYSETMEDWRIHKGVDFKGTVGQEVKALADGTVKDVYQDLLWGDCLTLEHGNGVISTYCGVTAAVKAGDRVTVGQSIGTLTVIPCECRMEPHLHLEISSGGAPLDPVDALGRDVRYSDSSSE